MVTDNRAIFKSAQNRYSLTYLSLDSFRFNISHVPVSEAEVMGFKNRYLFNFVKVIVFAIRGRAIFIKMDDADGHFVELLIHLFSAPQWRILSQFETGCFR